jgi:hypothetical protein
MTHHITATNKQLIEALDNTAAALETMLAHFSKFLSKDDVAGKERVLAIARKYKNGG